MDHTEEEQMQFFRAAPKQYVHTLSACFKANLYFTLIEDDKNTPAIQ